MEELPNSGPLWNGNPHAREILQKFDVIEQACAELFSSSGVFSTDVIENDFQIN